MEDFLRGEGEEVALHLQAPHVAPQLLLHHLPGGGPHLGLHLGVKLVLELLGLLPGVVGHLPTHRVQVERVLEYFLCSACECMFLHE